MCESICVSPWPGKCLSVASMPWSWRPRTYSCTRRDTARGSSPKERMLMIGFSGLLFTSASGDRKSTPELQSRQYLVCRLLLEKKKNKMNKTTTNKTPSIRTLLENIRTQTTRIKRELTEQIRIEPSHETKITYHSPYSDTRVRC